MSSIKVKKIILTTMAPGAQATMRVRTVTGASWYYIIAASVLPMGTALCTCIEPITAIQAAHFKSMHPNIAGACRYFWNNCLALALKVYDTWVYSITKAASLASATCVFSIRAICGQRALVLVPRAAFVMGAEIPCFYLW